jgi:hypothetical protein
VAPAELERAGDPEVPSVKADDLTPLMEDAPVAGPGPPQRRRDDLAGGSDSVALGHPLILNEGLVSP